METSVTAPPGATPSSPIREVDAQEVSAEVVGDFRMGDGPRTAVVVVTARARVVVTVLVGPGRVVLPHVRGDKAVRFDDRALARRAHKAALAAYAASFGEVQP